MASLNDYVYLTDSAGEAFEITDLAEIGSDGHALVADLVVNGRDFPSVDRIMRDHMNRIGISRMNVAAIGALYSIIVSWVAPMLDRDPEGEQARAMVAAALERRAAS
jgi:hypothetical protein